jgi:signal transduction histidine kinase
MPLQWYAAHRSLKRRRCAANLRAMKLSRRILIQIAIAVATVIFIGTAVTYYMVFRAAERTALRHLSDYDSERTAAEEAEFLRVEENLKMVRELFLKRDAQPVGSNVDGQWAERNELHADGAWRTRREGYDGRRRASMWVRKEVPVTFALKTRVLRAENILNDFILGWIDTFPSLYFIFPEQVNIGFDPRIPNWVWEARADYDTCAAAFFQDAVPERNPSRGVVWGSATREPVSQQPYVSVVVPIYRRDAFLGIVGHDIAVRELEARTSRTGLAGVTHFIFRSDGRLISHPEHGHRILATDGQFTLQESDDRWLRDLHVMTTTNLERHFEGYDEANDMHYTATRLKGPDWIFMSTLPRAELRRTAFASAKWVLWSGLGSLAVMLGAFSFILRRQIAQPLAELSRATHQMAVGDMAARAGVTQRDELGALATAFNEMASAVSERDAALERRVEERTAELSAANARLAEASEEALRSLAREEELGAMKSRFVTTVSHEFRNPLAIILSCSDVLQRFEDKLPPEQRRRQLEGINSAVQRMAGMMEEVLMLGRAEAGRLHCEPRELDLAACCRRLTDETLSATSGRCPIQYEHHLPPQPALADPGLLQHILTNLLGNAVKYSPAGSPVSFNVSADGGDAVFVIADKGSGISSEDMEKLYEPFHRGSDTSEIPGTGLGLVIVKRCVEIHGGSISCESTPGAGATFTVRLPVFSSPAPATP